MEKQHNLKVLTLSLDDFYKTRVDRQSMAKEVHPLFSRRGVPGTHDVDLANSTLSAVKSWATSSSIRIPWFDKSIDDRGSESEWISVTSAIDIVLFEGWCINAKPQSEEALAQPINQLEQELDPHGIWRSHVNSELAGDYQDLFNLIDYSITFYPPSFGTVCQWRSLQEQQLISKLELLGQMTEGTMNPKELADFMMHFERISRHHFFNDTKIISDNKPDFLRLRLDADRNATFMT